MQQFASKYIRLSDISAYLMCPRLAYFRRRAPRSAPSPETVRSAVFKELSRSLASALAADDPEAALRSHVEMACRDAEIVYGLPVEKIMDEAIGTVDDILAGLRMESARMGRDRLAAILDPYDRAQAVYSDRLRISGVIDRVALLDGDRCPVVVCASRPPEHGVYAADRLRLAACAMLAEEKYGGSVGRGVVEYVCGWRIREADVRKSDRMAVLSARNRIAQMGSAMPDARRGAWCAGCQHRDACNVRMSFMDSLFRPVLMKNSGLSRNGTDK